MLPFFKNLFQKQEKANSPVLHELIVRTDTEKHGYEAWKLNDHKDYVVGYLSKQFDNFWSGQQSPSDLLLILNTPKSMGFIYIYKAAQSDFTQFKYLFDYLKEKVKQLNYKVYVSDVKNFVRQNYVETIERHYLKPRFKFPDAGAGESVNQLYGNITVELLLHNDQPQHIKFVCQPYSDYKYSTALPFKDLTVAILN